LREEECSSEDLKEVKNFAARRNGENVAHHVVLAEIVSSYGIAPVHYEGFSFYNIRTENGGKTAEAIAGLRAAWAAEEGDVGDKIHQRARGDPRLDFAQYDPDELYQAYDDDNNNNPKERESINAAGQRSGYLIKDCPNSKSALEQRGFSASWWFPTDLPGPSETAQPRFLCTIHHYAKVYLTESLRLSPELARVLLDHRQELEVLHRWSYCHAPNCTFTGIPCMCNSGPQVVVPWGSACGAVRKARLPSLLDEAQAQLAAGPTGRTSRTR